MMDSSFATVASRGTIELDVLLHDYLLGLVLIAGAGPEGESRPVQWVHVSDLVDPTPFLTPRTVLLTTGGQFSHPLESSEADVYVARLQASGATALGVAIGLQWDRIPPPLIDACERRKLPLFRVPYDTPFIAIVRTAARLIEAEAHTTVPWGREFSSSSSRLMQRQSLAATEDALRIAVLKLLLAGQRDLAEEVSAALLPRLPRGQITVICLSGPLSPQLTAALAPLSTERPGVFSARRGEGLGVIAEYDELPALRQILSRHSTNAGISERGSMAELPELLEQAERSAELARLQQLAAPLQYRPEMHAGVLQLLQGSLEASRRAQGLLTPLRRHDERHRDDLEHSLFVWLAHHGQTSPAAAELGLHRHTLRTRVQSAASLLQRDLDDPDTRAELWAAFRLSAQAPGGSTP